MALLRATKLTITFPGSPEPAVADLSFSLHHGKTLCLVGESGSGKSLTARALMGLLPSGATMRGAISYEGDPIAEDRALTEGHRFCGRGMAMIFQEPMAALNPSMRVATLVGEAYRLRAGASADQTRERVCQCLEQTGILQPEELLSAYPWQLSGGLAQRVLIAASLILDPQLLIADEPTTALDVTTQAQILRVLARLRIERKLALLFITHDLSIAGLMGGKTLVMHRGIVVERGETRSVLLQPGHPYTRGLVASTPGVALQAGRKRLSPDGGDWGGP